MVGNIAIKKILDFKVGNKFVIKERVVVLPEKVLKYLSLNEFFWLKEFLRYWVATLYITTAFSGENVF